jgi:hypothetical protein
MAYDGIKVNIDPPKLILATADNSDPAAGIIRICGQWRA